MLIKIMKTETLEMFVDEEYADSYNIDTPCTVVNLSSGAKKDSMKIGTWLNHVPYWEQVAK